MQNEQNNRLDYYDTATWTLQKSVPSTCLGNNHADWSADGTYFLVTCEFSGDLIKVDTKTGDVLAIINLAPGAMPQDVRLTPDGKKFYVADMMSDGVWIVDGDTMTVTGQIATGVGAHGIYPSRDATYMYVSNRGRHMGDEHRRSRPGEGSVSVVDPNTNQVVGHLGDPRRRLARHGRRLGRRHPPVAVGALRRRGLRVRHGHRGAGRSHPDRPEPARPGGVAAAGSLQPRPHRQHPLTRRQRAADGSASGACEVAEEPDDLHQAAVAVDGGDVGPGHGHGAVGRRRGPSRSGRSRGARRRWSCAGRCGPGSG